ncbi:Aspartate aminotransferase [Exophiala dermatitidis]
MGSIDTNKSPLTHLAQQLRLSPTLQINELVQKKQAEGCRVVHLGFGEATFPIEKNVLKTHREACEETSYLPVAGLMKLRESIARFQARRLGVAIRPHQVVVAPGSKPLLFALFDILQGDVLLPRPSWVSYEPQVMHAGKQLFWVETDEEDRHTITQSALHSAFDKAVRAGANPRVMLINSPSNPTGQAFTKANLHLLADFCRDRAITLISDDIYSDVCFGDQYGASACSGPGFNEGRKILTGGLSKTYSAGGWRIGFAIFPDNAFGEEVKQSILAYASECWSAASAPAQEAAAVAFSTSPEMDLYRTKVTQLHQHCTLTLYRALQKCGLAVPQPKGSFYLYPSFHPYTAQLEKLGVTTSMDLSRWLIEECGIAALPGSAFGEDDLGLTGGRYRLRMATSYLYFQGKRDRYERGYALLDRALDLGTSIELPLLDEAIAAIQAAVAKLKAI